MANAEIINPTQHAQIKIKCGHGDEFGENIHFVPVVAAELRALVIDYPVFIMKDEHTGHFGLNALLGLAPGKNCYLKEGQWTANYIPLHLQRQPFLVASQSEGQGQLAIDMQSPRVSTSDGEALFDEQGQATPFLDQMRVLMSRLMVGIQATQAFVDKLSDLALIEPKALDVTLPSGEQKCFAGIYSVNEQKLQALNSEQLQSLHASGYLQACYLLLASAGNLQKVIASS